MAAIFHLLLLLLLIFSRFQGATSQPRQLNITLNSSLSPSTKPNSWLSTSGRFAFGFYPKGGGGFNIGVWLTEPSGERVIVWTANRDGPPVSSDARLLLTSNRGLVLQSGGDTSISRAAEATSFASMLDSGNFVLYNSDSQIIWETFDSPTDTILGGQRLLAGNELLSSASENNRSSGRFRMKMQKDGNLVFYPIQRLVTPEDAYWASNTAGSGDNVTLYLDESGFMYMLKNTGFFIYNLTKGFDPPTQSNTTNIYRATLEIDGIFRLYVHRFRGTDSLMTSRPVWSLMSNYCEVKGFCGLNSYCVLNDTQGNCLCPKGFEFVDPNQTFLGCKKKFIDECIGKEKGVKYDIFNIPNTVWNYYPYETVPSLSEDDCRKACLLDCQCEVARYSSQNCYKQRLPLRYWRRKFDASTTAFVKFGSGNGNSTTMDDPLNPEGPKLDRRSKNGLQKEVLFVGIGLVLCSFVLAIAGFLIYKKWVGRYKPLSETANNGNESEEFSPRPFTYDELMKATDGFKVELGRGAFGTVYRGVLQNGRRIVAVKRLDRALEEGEREFRTEMQAIGSTHHRNLVRLLGFCVDGPQRLLVYEYMSNGSLADLLFSPEKRPNWDERVRIAMDIAKGILYLHEDCENPIIHCDIKPQNILMDEFYRAKISDFGLAKLMKPDQTRTFTGIRGTKGYVAPEWHRNMPVTVKADVYSFGVVLLEIICCRRNVETTAEEEKKILCYWAYDCFEAGEVQELVNFEEVDKRSLENMVKVGLWCIQDKPSLRPSMKRVVMMFEGAEDVPTPPLTSFLNSP